MRFSLREVAAILGAKAAEEAAVKGWSVDTRTLEPGDLFFALAGPNHDGHRFLEQAFEKGAVAAVAERQAGAKGILLRVPNVLGALQALAGRARDRWGGEVVGVTGSAGKTTTKDMSADLLSAEIATGRTVGNFNNHVGVPLSLLRLPDDARVAVIEIGMNRAGEIRELARIARPQIGVVTNVGWAHVEFFEGIDGIAAAKRELIEALPADGVAVLNADDARVARFRDFHPGKTVTFGLSPEANVRAEEVEYSLDGVKFRVGRLLFEASLSGRHSVLNILAGIAVAGLYGIAPERLRDPVRSLAPGPMRGERFTSNGILVYNDCYNSNPDAVRSMLDVLRDTPARRRIAVLGEMLELGRWAEPLHRDVGKYVAASGIDVLVGIRGAACHIVDAATDAGLNADAAYFFEDPSDAGVQVRALAQPGDAVLFKGSRGTHVERALERFLA